MSPAAANASIRRLLSIASRAVALRPVLGIEAVRFAFAAARRGWVRRPPFVPVPDPAYLQWRITTAYGDDGEPTLEDMAEFLAWRRRLRRSRS